MSISDEVIMRYGKDIRIGSTESRGFIRPKAADDPNITRKPLAPGISNDESYLLIAAAGAMTGMPDERTLVCGGLEYEILRVHPLFIGEELSHWEAVMRLKGAVSNA